MFLIKWRINQRGLHVKEVVPDYPQPWRKRDVPLSSWIKWKIMLMFSSGAVRGSHKINISYRPYISYQLSTCNL